MLGGLAAEAVMPLSSAAERATVSGQVGNKGSG